MKPFSYNEFNILPIADTIKGTERNILLKNYDLFVNFLVIYRTLGYNK